MIPVIIESVRLENIRSYANEAVKFPAGSVLLEGDIGCGKSSILLAVDFALFGLRANELSGSELLRHGKNNGKVTLNIRLGGCSVEISRTLERKKDGIVQSAGHITVDGIKHDLMGMGLRSFIFDLLGYPLNLLKKNKSLLYRYTVYTPQEQMKAILLISPDERMSIMRHVFGIDRYVRLRNNAAIVARRLRMKMERLRGISEGLEDAEKSLSDFLKKSKVALEEKSALSKQAESMSSEASEKKKALESAEKEKEHHAALLSKIEILKSKKSMTERQVSLAEKEVARAQERKKEIFSNGADDISKKISALEKDTAMKQDVRASIDTLEKELRGIDASLSENGTREKMSREVLDRISKISKCPTCLQDVGESHKKGIHSTEGKRIENFAKICARLLEEKTLAAKRLEGAKKSLEEIGEKERMLAGLRAQEKEMARLASDIASKEDAILRLKKDEESFKSEAEALEKEAEKLSGAKEKYALLKKDAEILEGELSLKKQALARLEQQASDIEANIDSLGKDIADMKKSREALEKARGLHSWLEDVFSPLMETIERHMMGKIHHEFNSIFREWFSMLIDDETLSARVDATFTPVVEENGFETEFGHLSGGEKTSVALAYRLTMNRVINSLSDMIKTKDILILDEPTDGFSTEQLDKVRDVLRNLALRQIIIVSHENKIEGFVDSVIRIEKKNGESRVVA